MVSVNDEKSNDQKVSVIIVTYNAAITLQNCLNSIYKQTYPHLEIIIIDGESIDGTVDIIKSNSDKITYWESQRDKGIYDAMNKGLNHISGEWVYFLGADDELLVDFSAMLYLLNDQACIYYGNVLMGNKKTGAVADAYKHAKSNISHQAIVYPASVFKKYRYDIQYPIAADFVLNMQCWNNKSFRFQHVDLTIANFNDSGISSTHKDAVFEKKRVGLTFKYYGFKTGVRFFIRRVKEKMNPAKYAKQ